MSEDPFRDRLRELEGRIAAAQSARKEPVRGQSEYTQSSLAWRMVTELVAGMLLGVGIGYGLDSLLGTLPWLLMLFAVLGFVAGVRTMMRTAEEVRRRQGEAARMGPAPEARTTGPAGPDGE